MQRRLQMIASARAPTGPNTHGTQRWYAIVHYFLLQHVAAWNGSSGAANNVVLRTAKSLRSVGTSMFQGAHRIHRGTSTLRTFGEDTSMGTACIQSH